MPQSRASIWLSALALIVFPGLLTGCISDRILLREVPIKGVQVQPSDLRVGIQGLRRMESDKYQGLLEKAVVRGIQKSGLFSSVTTDVVDPAQVDVVLRFGRGTSAFERRVNLSYVPLALGTLTLSIWLGGPVGTDIEFYEIVAEVLEPGGAPLFDLRTRKQYSHWANIYSQEYWAFDGRCSGPHADEAIADFVKQLAVRLAELLAVEGAGHFLGDVR